MILRRSRLFMLVSVLIIAFILQSFNAFAKKNSLIYEGKDYSIELNFSSRSNITDNAVLEVNEFMKGTKEYQEYFEETNEYVKQDMENTISDVRFFDIKIMDGSKEIEPDDSVNVFIRYKEAIEKSKDQNIGVIHFVDDKTKEYIDVQEKNDESEMVSAISFEQSSFSVIGMIIFDGIDTGVKHVNSDIITEMSSITVEKQWSDGNINHEKDEIEITLFELVQSEWIKHETKKLNTENNWKSKFENLDTNKKYGISETKVITENDSQTTYESVIEDTSIKAWCRKNDNTFDNQESIVLICGENRKRLLRKSSSNTEMNLRANLVETKSEENHKEYCDKEISGFETWDTIWNEEYNAWELYHSYGDAYLSLFYNSDTGCYEWITTKEKNEGSYLDFSEGTISATIDGVKKYLGNISEQGPYEALDEGEEGKAVFHVFSYQVYEPGEIVITNIKNETIEEKEIDVDIITEKTIDYLGDKIENPDTDVDNKGLSEKILKDLYRLNLSMKMKTDAIGLDLLLVIDVSSSMKETKDCKDGNGNYILRSEALRQALNQFVPDILPEESKNRLSIVAFETESIILQEWTQDASEILEKVNYTKDGDMPLYNGEGTNYEAALIRAHEAFTKCGYSSNAKAMVFLSDGVPTVYIKGNDNPEDGNVTVNLGDSSLSDSGIAGDLEGNLFNVWYTDEVGSAVMAADAAVRSFKRHNPEIMIGTIAFNTKITDCLKNLSTNQKNVVQIENGTPGDLIEAMELITEFVPKRVIITDELTENVEIYKEDPDYKITVTDNFEKEEILYTSDMGLTEKGKIVLDNTEPVIEKEGKIQMKLNDNYIVEDNNIYSLSFNINTSQKAFNKYADSQGIYTDVGDKGTDLAGNNTSSGKEGFYSNGDNTKVKYYLNGAEIEKKYKKPVVQVREGTISVKKTDIYGNIINGCAEFALYRKSENDEKGEYTLIAEAKTDNEGEILFKHLRLSVFDAGYTYYLVEKISPEGYVKIETPIEILLYEDEVRVNSTNKFITTEKKLMDDGSLVGQVIIRNAKNVDFIFTKVETGNENNKLDDAEFMIYKLICREEKHTHGNECWKYITKKNSNPEVLFENLSSAAVYKLVETKAPDQYVLPDGYWIISIDENSNVYIDKEGSVPGFFRNEKGEWILGNEKMIDVPVTGGSGNMRFFIFGIMLITGGIFMIRKRYFSKLMMIIMALIICFQSLPVTTFAINSAETGRITVNGVEENVNVKAYKLMNVNYDYGADQPKNPVYQWVSGIAGWVNEKHEEYIDTENNNAVEELFSQVAEGNAALFYDELAVAIKEGNVAIEETTIKATDDTVTINNLEMGNYFLLIEGGTKVYRPLTANIVPEWIDNSWKMSQPVVEAKASAPSITKTMKGEIKKENIDIGDIVSFELAAVVPAYPDNAKAKKYVISDRLSEGLSLVEESIKVYGINSGKEAVLMESGYEKVTKRPVITESSQVSFALDFTYDEIKLFESLKITYDAVLNENAVAGETGNKNSAYLDYSNNPYIENDYATDDDTVTIYTYGLKINKIDEDTNESLGGAEFTLSKDDLKIKFIGENGNYRVAKDGENGNSVVKVNENGMLVLKGLDVDTYSLVEVKAPDGYVKLQNPVKVVISDENMDGIAEAGNQEFLDGYIPVIAKNDKGFTLPVTGGMGPTLFNIAGIALILGGLLLIIVYVRKKNHYR